MGLDTAVRNLIEVEVQRQVELQLAKEMARLGLGGQVDRRLSMHEAAEVARVDLSSLRRWRARGLPVQGRGRSAFIHESKLLAFIAAGGRRGGPVEGSGAAVGTDATKTPDLRAAEIVGAILKKTPARARSPSPSSRSRSRSSRC